MLYINYISILKTVKMVNRDFPGNSVVKDHLPVQEAQETRAPSLGREDPLEEEMATHSNILAWRIPMDRAWQAPVHRVTKLDATEYKK